MHEKRSSRKSSLQLLPSLLHWFYCHGQRRHLQEGMADTASVRSAAPAGAAPYGGTLHAAFIRDRNQNAHTLPTQPNNCQKIITTTTQQQQQQTRSSHTADSINQNKPAAAAEETQHRSAKQAHRPPGYSHHMQLYQDNTMHSQSSESHRNLFPFDQLPTDCKLKVFECLDPISRGVSRRVCQEWYRLMMRPSLWSNLDFTMFPLCFDRQPDHECSKACYVTYCARMKAFMTFLAEIRPALKQLRFAYDIEEHEDGWLASIEDVLNVSVCHELKSAHINWKETPIKPLTFWMEHTYGSYVTNDSNDLTFRHRHRHRTFVNFFENFVSLAPNLCSLRMQFGWSMRSICNLSLLRNLHTLILEKYFVYQPVSQASLDQLFKCTPRLRRLILEVWTPGAQGLVKFHLASASLRHLDLSKCRGFYLESVDLPALHSFVFQGHPWNGPLVFTDTISLPCLRTILVKGAPRLLVVNNFTLEEDWRCNIESKFEAELRTSCMCRAHKKGYVM